MALGPNLREALRVIVRPVLQTVVVYSWGTSGGNAEEKAHSSSSLLVAGGAGAGAGADGGAGVAEREAAIRLANGSTAGCFCCCCGGCGGVREGCAGWGVAELDAGGEENKENPGEGEFAWLFCVTEESRAGPGMSGHRLASPSPCGRARELTLICPEPQGDIARLAVTRGHRITDAET